MDLFTPYGVKSPRRVLKFKPQIKRAEVPDLSTWRKAEVGDIWRCQESHHGWWTFIGRRQSGRRLQATKTRPHSAVLTRRSAGPGQVDRSGLPASPWWTRCRWRWLS